VGGAGGGNECCTAPETPEKDPRTGRAKSTSFQQLAGEEAKPPWRSPRSSNGILLIAMSLACKVRRLI